MNKEKFLWILFVVDLIIILFHLIGGLVGISFAKSSIIQLSILAFPVLILFLHSYWTLSAARSFFFIALASLIGFLAEYIGLNSGTIFGGHYIYQARSQMLLNVPISVILYWAVFTYMGYSIVNSFLYWKNKNKPRISHKNILLIPILCILDGLIVTAIDLFMDPLQVSAGNWTWVNGGPYFGVPIGNFVGWFMVVIIITGIFRSFEYFKPQKHIDVSKNIFLLPVLGYAVVWFAFLLSAFESKMYSLALVGSLVMLPTILINLSTFIRNKN